jgi:hypothetical protein
MAESLRLVKTELFSVLDGNGTGFRTSTRSPETVALATPSPSNLPVMTLADLILHKELNRTDLVRTELLEALKRHGFVFLKVPKRSAPGQIVDGMRRALHDQLFPNDRKANPLPTSDVTYISETSVPMWKIGYEKSEDGVREFFRMHAGIPDDLPWPNAKHHEGLDFLLRETWLQGLALCRNVCDQALELCMMDHSPRKRPGSGSLTFRSTKYCQTPVNQLPERPGDFSVLYAMHYFNQTDLGGENDERDPCCTTTKINVKQHVDPSLFVLEPFLAANCKGLQVLDQLTNQWVDCDGPSSPVCAIQSKDDDIMCLFVGRAFSRHFPDIAPTLHRVVASNQSRRSIIYEQKYEEYWD